MKWQGERMEGVEKQEGKLTEGVEREEGEKGRGECWKRGSKKRGRRKTNLSFLRKLLLSQLFRHA